MSRSSANASMSKRPESTRDAMDDKILELRASPMFRHLSSDVLARIAPEVIRRVYCKGQIIVQQGEPALGFYLVLFGRVKIRVSSGSGKEQVLHFYGPGDSFGEAAMLSGNGYPVDVVTLERTRLAFVPARPFEQELVGDPEFGRMVMRSMAKRLAEFTHIIEDLSTREVKARLACYLLRERARDNELDLPVSKGELAHLLGTTAESLSRSLRSLSDQGAIAVDGRHISLLNADALMDLADE